MGQPGVVQCAEDAGGAASQVRLASSDGADGAPAGDPGLAFTEEAFLETPRGEAGYWGPGEGLPEGTAVRAHGGGAVALMRFDGEEIWQRSGSSFFEDWGIDPYVLPEIRLGRAPGDPFAWWGENLVAVGDLTGDGTVEIVVAHLAWVEETEHGVGALTVLDGQTGATLWAQTYGGAVTQLAIHEGRLVVGLESGDPQGSPRWRVGQEGAVSTVFALALHAADGRWEATEQWSFAAEQEWTRWLDLIPAGDDRVAVAGTSRPVGEPGEAGQVVVLDVLEGTAATAATPAYPMNLAYDGTRELLVVHEQVYTQRETADEVLGVETTELVGFRYRLRALDPSTLQETEDLRITTQDRLLVTLLVADLTGDGTAEWATSDVGFPPPAVTTGVDPDDNDVCPLPCEPVGGVQLLPQGASTGLQSVASGSHVTVFSPGDADAQWEVSSESEEDFGTQSGLIAVDAGGDRLLVTAGDGGIRAFDGSAGETAWATDEDVLALWLVPDEDGATFLGGTEDNVVKRFSAADGSLHDAWPLLAQPHHVVTVDGSGGDGMLVVGTGSRGVFALDAGLTEPATVNWSTLLADRVFELQAADVTGDGDDEIVAAAGRAGIYVLDQGGDVLDHVAFEGSLVWTVAVAGSDGDGMDLLVPTEQVTRLSWNTDQEGLEVTWTNPVVAEDDPISNLVVSQGLVLGQFSANLHHPAGWLRGQNQVTFALDAHTGAIAWLQPLTSGYGNWPHIWDSVALLEGAGVDGGDAAAFSYRSWGTANPGEGPLGVRAYDVATGLLLWNHPYLDSGTHTGQVVHDGRLVEHNWGTTVIVDEQAAQPIHLGVQDAAMVTVDGRDVLLAAASGSNEGTLLQAWGADVLDGPYEPDAPLALWHRHRSGQGLHPQFEGDRLQALVTTPFDYGSWAEVVSLEGTLLLHANSWPEGIGLLQLEAGSGP